LVGIEMSKGVVRPAPIDITEEILSG